MRLSSALALLTSVVSASAQETCSGGQCAAGEVPDQTSLLQVKPTIVAIEGPDVEEGGNTYGPYSVEGHVLDYFRHWSSASVEKALTTSSPLSASNPMIGLLEADTDAPGPGWALSCQDNSPPVDAWELLEEDTAEDVQHTLFRTGDGKLQYVATEKSDGLQSQVLAADPPVCRPPALLDEGTGPHPTEGGEPEQLATSDPVVADCVALLARTTKQNCGKSYEFKVLAARVKVVDGLKVTLSGMVIGGPKPTHHSPACLFEQGKSKHSADDELGQRLPEERDGQRATLSLQTPLCHMEEVDGVDDTEVEANLFQEQYKATSSWGSSGCTCPGSYPYCYSKNKWCYKSSTSNSYSRTCGGKCTASGR